MHSTSVYGLELLVLVGAEEKALDIDHRGMPTIQLALETEFRSVTFSQRKGLVKKYRGGGLGQSISKCFG